MIEFLYRGFNSDRTKEVDLIPKNPNGGLEMAAQCGDERVECGDEDFTFGESIGNAIHIHEYAQNGEPTGYISFTPDFDRAKFYALKGGEYEKGTVIKISVHALKERGFNIFTVNEVVKYHPACIADDEHSVYVGNRTFPLEVIVEETTVYRNET